MVHSQEAQFGVGRLEIQTMRKSANQQKGAWRSFGKISTAMFCAFVSISNLQAEKTVPEVAIIQGAPGEEAYEKKFQRWSDNFFNSCVYAERPVRRIHKPEKGVSPKDQIRNWLKLLEDTPKNPIWIFMIGHGTFDGKSAKFNLHGSDISAEDLKTWLKPHKDRTVLIINTASSSAPFLTKLSASNHVILTATRSGSEYNSTQLANFLSANIINPDADLDQDGQTSLLEAWLHSTRELADHYKQDGRIQTEHSILDDNADGKGTQPKAFIGILPKETSEDSKPPDGFRAHQFHLRPSDFEKSLTIKQKKSRDALELEIFKLRQKKSVLTEDEYYQELEVLLRKLGKIYLAADDSKKEAPKSN